MATPEQDIRGPIGDRGSFTIKDAMRQLSMQTDNTLGLAKRQDPQPSANQDGISAVWTPPELKKQGSSDVHSRPQEQPSPSGQSGAENAVRRSASRSKSVSEYDLSKMNVYDKASQMSAHVRILPNAISHVSSLGAGAFCVVDKAEYSHDGMKEVVAVKMMKPRVADRKGEVDAFLKEAETLARVQHRTIVGYKGLGSFTTKADAGLFVVQEYLPGGSLKAVLLKQAKSPDSCLYSMVTAMRWMLSLAEALAYLHQLRPIMVIHRDVKSDNIFLSDSQDVNKAEAKLGDFGLHQQVRITGQVPVIKMPNTFKKEDLDSILEDANGKQSPQAKKRKVRRGSWLMAFQEPPSTQENDDGQFHLTQMCGSLLYMAPEVYNGEMYCEKCDVFSMAVVMFEILAQTHMVLLCQENGSPITVKDFVKKVANGWRPAIPPHVPRALADLIRDCWAQRQEDRPSAQTAANRLKALLARPGRYAFPTQEVTGNQCCRVM